MCVCVCDAVKHLKSWTCDAVGLLMKRRPCPFRYLPREVDPLVYNMSHEDPGNVSYSEIGGLSEQIRELREVQARLLRPSVPLLKGLPGGG